MITIVILLLLSIYLSAQVKFDDYFLDKTLRMDYYHSGNAESDYYTFDELIEEPYWGGSKINLIDTFEYGNFMLKVYSVKNDDLIYSRGFSTLFQEWQTTEEAKNIKRSFLESVILPYPKDTVRIEIHQRDHDGDFIKAFEYVVDPTNYFISKERKKNFDKFTVHETGSPDKKLDIVFIPDGYSRDELDSFKVDCEKFKEYLFSYPPFRENIENINIWGVNAFSEESGTDIPRDSIWKRTLLNSSFYTFDTERYLMTTDYKSVRDVASNAPYDQIYILVNTDKYGGGAIYNYYSVTAAKNNRAKKIFIHEFGHGFGGLADEYFTSDVAYQNFYPLDVEPWEPNITTLVDFDKKWKHLTSEGATVPTEVNDNTKNKVGVFEGAGYAENGIYRSTFDSIMRSFATNNFNQISIDAMQKLIQFYSE